MFQRGGKIDMPEHVRRMLDQPTVCGLCLPLITQAQNCSTLSNDSKESASMRKAVQEKFKPRSQQQPTIIIPDPSNLKSWPALTPKQPKLIEIASAKRDLNSKYDEARKAMASWRDIINSLDESGFTELSNFVKKNDTQSILKLLDLAIFGQSKRQNIEVDKMNKDGSNALFLSLASSEEVIEKILSLKPQTNFIYDATGYTILMTAILQYPDKMPILFSHGVDVNFQNKLGQTALHVAIINKKYEAIQEILAADADVDIVDINGKTPILLAATIGVEGLKMVVMLLNARAKLSFEQLEVLEIEPNIMAILSKIIQLDACENDTDRLRLLNEDLDFISSENYMQIVKISQARYSIIPQDIEFLVSIDREIEFKQCESYLVLKNDFANKNIQAAYITILDKDSHQERLTQNFPFSKEVVRCLDALYSYTTTEVEEAKKMKISHVQDAMRAFTESSIIEFIETEVIKRYYSPNFIIMHQSNFKIPATDETIELYSLAKFAKNHGLEIVDSSEFTIDVDGKAGGLEVLGHQDGKLCPSEIDKQLSSSDLAFLVHCSQYQDDADHYPFNFGITLHDFDMI